MSGSQQMPWSNNSTAPNISYDTYLIEKSGLAGLFVGSMLYGVIFVVAFKCIAALLNPAHRKGEGVKWGFVCYTAAMFSLATVLAGMDFNIRSICYIDNRDFPGAEGMIPPGPFGYQWIISPSALDVTPNVAFTLCNWLADGLLLYRCYIIYGKSLWVIAFPCIMYLGSVAMGIVLVYVNSDLAISTLSGNTYLSAYLSLSFSLNILLTLMIIIRIILHARNTRAAVGISGIGGMSKAIVTMLVESCALYAVSILLFLGPLNSDDSGATIMEFFLPIVSQTQVIAPLLIIQRVANKSALTSNTIASLHLSSFKTRSRGISTGGSGALPDGDPTSSVDRRGVGSGEPGIEVETRSDFHQDNI